MSEELKRGNLSGTGAVTVAGVAGVAGTLVAAVAGMDPILAGGASAAVAKAVELGAEYLRSLRPDRNLASAVERLSQEDCARAFEDVGEQVEANLRTNLDVTASEYRATLDAFASAFANAMDSKKKRLVMAGVVNSFDPETYQQSLTKELFELVARHSYGALRLLRAIARKDWVVVACGEPGQPDERLGFADTEPGARVGMLAGWEGVRSGLRPVGDTSNSALWRVIEPWRRYLTPADASYLRPWAVRWPDGFFDLESWGQVSTGILFRDSLVAEHLIKLEADRLVSVGKFVQLLPKEHARHPIEVQMDSPPVATGLGRLLARFIETPAPVE